MKFALKLSPGLIRNLSQILSLPVLRSFTKSLTLEVKFRVCLQFPIILCSDIFMTFLFTAISYLGNWDIVPWIRRQIQPVPRVAISKALSNPAAYMGCTCCSTDGQESGLLPSMPDLCLVYKLHMECGRLINLYDWMVSFNCVHRKV